MQVSWKGVYPAVTTKFKEDESLDVQAFEYNLNAQLEAGVHAFVLAGSLGEASTLLASEKLDLLAAARNVSAGRIPVIMNIAERSTRMAIKTAVAAEKNGADGIMLLPPLLYGADDREVVTYFKSVANAISIPVMIYNNPVDYKIGVTVEMFEELIECENIQAVKESTRDTSNVVRMKNAFGDRIKILCGVDTLALECLSLGADGWVAGLVDAFPRETVVIYELVKAGRVKEALKIYAWFMPLLELDIRPKLVQYIKMAEVATGIGTEKTRAPRLRVAGEERKNVLNIINKALASRPDLSAYKNNALVMSKNGQVS